MKINLLLLFLFANIFSVKSQTTDVYSINPKTGWWSNHQPLNIKNAVINIEPKGKFAMFDFTFQLEMPQGFNYTVYDTLETRCFFNMPQGSYFFDSWLWLNSSTIIKASIYEKRTGITIYDNIVKRRRDPSLLIKNNDQYEFDVYPITINYPRKVKLSFAVPIDWNSNELVLPIPMLELLTKSSIKSGVNLTIKESTIFNSHTIKINSILANNYKTNTQGNITSYYFPASVFNTTNLVINAQFLKPQFDAILSIQKTSNNEGYFELISNTQSLTSSQTKNCVNFVIHHTTDSVYTYSWNNYNYIYLFDSIKANIKKSLLANLGTIDSFNLFFENAHGITQTSSNWLKFDATNISMALNLIPSNFKSKNNEFDSLLIKAIKFTQTKSSFNASTLIISNDGSRSYNSNALSTYNKLIANVGTLNNQISVLNYSQMNYQTGQGWNGVNGNLPLWMQLTNTTKGEYQNCSNTYLFLSHNNYFNSINSLQSLNVIFSTLNYKTSSFYYNIPIINGFKYNEFNTLNGLTNFNYRESNFEIGQFLGNVDSINSLQLYLKLNGTWQTLPLTNIFIDTTQNTHIRKAWNSILLNKLTGTNTWSFNLNGYKEAVDSSINSNVICNYTVFLALENGDTITVSQNNNNTSGGGGGSIGLQQYVTDNTLKIFPNPFTDELNISAEELILKWELYDAQGKKIAEQNSIQSTQFKIDGNLFFSTLTKGIYFINIVSQNKKYIRKIIKN